MTSAEAIAAIKLRSGLIEKYCTDAVITALLADHTTTEDGVTTYDIEAAATACLSYARGLVPVQKTIGNVSATYESINKTLNGMSPGGNVDQTRPLYEYGEQEEDD